MVKSKMEGGIGFRELALFNDSLLAKQTWQLLHNKPFFFYKVFKAPLFFFSPNSTIMEAKNSRASSYAWTSILRGRDVIRRGYHRRLRNGNSVKI